MPRDVERLLAEQRAVVAFLRDNPGHKMARLGLCDLVKEELLRMWL